mmetsp:Transcript_161403/g.286257  ORF Transcript_161403/g.286257 Transcript_161403/m.286257 type:complete len:297 (+) Transcript_161403:46-936(+)
MAKSNRRSSVSFDARGHIDIPPEESPHAREKLPVGLDDHQPDSARSPSAASEDSSPLSDSVERHHSRLERFKRSLVHEEHLESIKKQLLEMPIERIESLKHHLSEEIEHLRESPHRMSKAELRSQHNRVAELPMPVRIVGIVFGLLAVICTWEALDHIVVFLFPRGKLQIVAQGVLLMIGLMLLWISKKLSDIEWMDVGTFGFTLSSLMAAASVWGLVVAIVRLYVRKSSRLGVWTIGSAAMLILSLLYTLLTKHNALIDIASCATSLGYFDADNVASAQAQLQSGPKKEDYKACA